jgi:F0F1-type ATP synthase epsilon subunit
VIVTISTPLSKRLVNVAWLELNTAVGNFVIERGHAPTIIALAPGKPLIYMLKNGKQESLIVNRGVVEITRTTAIVLMNEGV